MKSNIICINPECKEIPSIRLINESNIYKIDTDCPFHHYEFYLEEYLKLLKEYKKNYDSICHKHNKKYIGFLEDTTINVCDDCIENENDAKISLFKDLKIDDYIKRDFKYIVSIII